MFVHAFVWIGFALATGAAAQSQENRTTAQSPAEEFSRRLERVESRLGALETRSKAPAELGTRLIPIRDDSEIDGVDAKSSYARPRPAINVVESTLDASQFVLCPPIAERNPSSRCRIGGRIHIDGTLFPTSSPGIGFFENPSTGEDPENRLEFRRLRLEFSGDIRDDMLYKLDLEFSDPNNPQVLDAYLGFQDVPFFQSLLIGNQVRPLGLDVLTSSNHTVFMENALVFGESNVDSRRLGVLSQGYSSDESVNWQFGVFELPNLQSSGKYLDDAFEASVHGRITSTPWFDDRGEKYFFIGVNTSFANVNDDVQIQSRPELRTESRWIDTGAIAESDWFNSAGLESVINIGPLSVGGEWVETVVHRSGGLPALFFHGGYLYATYFLTDDFQPFDRKLGVLAAVHPNKNFQPASACCGWGAWQVAARVSYFDLTDDNIFGGNETNVTLGLNWWFNANSRLMFNYVAGSIDEHAAAGGYTGGHFSGLAMRVQIAF